MFHSLTWTLITFFGRRMSIVLLVWEWLEDVKNNCTQMLLSHKMMCFTVRVQTFTLHSIVMKQELTWDTQTQGKGPQLSCHFWVGKTTLRQETEENWELQIFNFLTGECYKQWVSTKQFLLEGNNCTKFFHYTWFVAKYFEILLNLCFQNTKFSKSSTTIWRQIFFLLTIAMHKTDWTTCNCKNSETFLNKFFPKIF